MLSFSQCDIFPQLLHNSLYNDVYSISATYTYSTVYNYSPQYTGFAVYICFPFHNVIFFHNYCTIHSTTMSIAYPQHIHCPTKSIRTPPNIHVVNRLNIQLGAKMVIANIQVSKGVVLVLTLVEIFIILGFHEVLIYWLLLNMCSCATYGQVAGTHINKWKMTWNATFPHQIMNLSC